MKKFKFVTVSKDNKFMMSEDDFIHASDIADISVKFIQDNKDSICKVYNKQIDDLDYDFIIFIHSDVRLDVRSLVHHIIECESKYDVMGLCGCEKVQTSRTPFNWFTSSSNFPEFRWGFVTHGELDNRSSYFNADRSDINDHRVGCIDGLCIIISRRAIEAGLRFDEMFMFDQYDTDISFQTILRYKLRLGVIVEKSLQHYSVGRSILSDDFLVHELDFRRKWNLDIPKNSRLEVIANQIIKPQ